MQLTFDPELWELFPEKVYQIQASTPLDALKLLATQHELAGKMEPVPVRIRELKDLPLLLDPSIQNKTFEIIPADKSEVDAAFYGGSGGDNAFLNIVIGVVIVVVSVVATPAAGAGVAGAAGTGGAAAAGFSWGAFAAQAAMSIGVSLILTGVMQLLAPKQEKDGNKSSRKFGTGTTSDLGTPIQLILGKHLVYFHLLSFNVDSRKYDGVDHPDDSPYFKDKVNQNMPTVKLNRFYGVYQAGDETKLLQVDNEKYRTGLEH